jgi:hypothetical protein
MITKMPLLALAALTTLAACGEDRATDEDRRHGAIHMLANDAVKIRDRDGRCPDAATVLARRDWGESVRRFVVLCGESDGARHLAVIDLGKDGAIGSPDDYFAWR